MNDVLTNIDWNDFHFLRPEALWLLLPAFVALLLALIGLRERVKWESVIAVPLRPFMIKKGSERFKRRMHIILFLLISIAIVGAAGPSVRKNEVPEQILETPLVIVLDLSQSMMATDIQPNRLERAKFKLLDLFEAKPGARSALIGFAGTAHVIVPLTRDYKIITSHLQSLSPEVMPFPGSDLTQGLILGDSLCNVTPAPGTVMVLSDDVSEDNFTSLQRISTQSKNRFVLMPMNTPAGSDIPTRQKNRFFKGADGQNIHSALDTQILQKIAALDNVDVSRLTLDNSDVELIAKNISENLEFKQDEDEQEDNSKDDGIWLIIPLALLILLWFRKGWVIYSLLIILTLSSCGEKSNFTDLWVSNDFQAQTHYGKGEYEQAGELYEDPLRKGVAWYKAGDYQRAVEAFEQDTTAMGAYNLGLAYYQNGDYAAAANAFGRAVELDPDLEGAKRNQDNMSKMLSETDPMSVENAEEVPQKEQAQNMENKDTEDLGGGGQEATEEDMQQERKEETVATDMRTGKEMEEVPEDFESGNSENSQKVLMRKVDDDPSFFLKRKFKYQVKTKKRKPKNSLDKW